jgi:hypothetical protein
MINRAAAQWVYTRGNPCSVENEIPVSRGIWGAAIVLKIPSHFNGRCRSRAHHLMLHMGAAATPLWYSEANSGISSVTLTTKS